MVAEIWTICSKAFNLLIYKTRSYQQMHRDHILIAIPTFRRPKNLERLLRSLRSTQGLAKFTICVIENDVLKQEGLRLVDNHFPEVACVVAENHGLASARNKILDQIYINKDFNWLAMCDDDQTVHPDWLDAALSVAHTYFADVVGCAVHPVFPKGTKSWVTKANIYNRDTTINGQVYLLRGLGGVLIRRTCLEIPPGISFDERYNHSGGEDAAFLRQLKGNGAVFARAANSVVYEHYPPDRLTLSWALRRAYRIGITDTDITLSHQGANHRSILRIPGQALLLVLRGVIDLPIDFIRRKPVVNGACKISRGIGIMRAFFLRKKLPDDYKDQPDK